MPVPMTVLPPLPEIGGNGSYRFKNSTSNREKNQAKMKK
jgi:hypothetical protein